MRFSRHTHLSPPEERGRGEGKKLMRLLGIDFGFARIGAAVTDDAVGLPTALPTFPASGKLKVDAGAIASLAKRQEADKIVLGLPLEDGTEGKMARIMRQLGGHLQASGLVVDYVDETLTSVEAESVLLQTGMKASERRKHRDGEAACRILERYLDR
jgi:putative Holliday junction resolvase